MHYKLLVLDIDETIVPTDGTMPSPAVIDAITQAKKLLPVCFATARGIEDTWPVADILGIRSQYHVVENGAKILTPEGNIAFRYYLTSTEVQDIIDVCAGLYDEIGFCSDSTWINQLTAPQTDTISVMSFVSHSKEKAAQIPSRLQSLPAQYTVAAGKHWSEPQWGLTIISHASASKGQGIHHIQKAMNILPSETIMIGDGITDLTAFPYAGLKIAMRNGDQALIEAADYVAPHVNDDGAADAIIKFILT